jgi:hypothetical protein
MQLNDHRATWLPGVLVSVCASTQLKCMFQGAPSMRSLNDTGGGCHSRSSEFMNHHTLTLPIQYSILSPICPARSQILQLEPVDTIIHIEPPS